MICQAKGCDKLKTNSKFCRSHYDRHRRHGDPLGGQKTYNGEPLTWLMEQLEAFRKQPTDACLFWIYARGKNGYGGVTYEKKYQLVHRVVCEIFHGKPTHINKYALHSCGNGNLSCFNPNHLRWGTQKQNIQDTVHHGRSQRGEKSHKAVLSEADVLFIRRAEANETMTQSELAKKFNVRPSNISQICNRKSWAWLIDPEDQKASSMLFCEEC